MQGLLLALTMNFVAELGDKTQLVVLTFATRYKPLVVLAAMTAGTAASQGLSALVGGLVGDLLPDVWVKLLAGLAFLLFGVWTLRDSDEEDEDEKNGRRMNPFFLIASTFFLAEMGDKSMLGNMALSAVHSPLMVFLGGTLGMVLSDCFAVLIGASLGERLPKRAVKIGAAAMFLLFGTWSLAQGAVILHPYGWVAAIILAGGLGYSALRIF